MLHRKEEEYHSGRDSHRQTRQIPVAKKISSPDGKEIKELRGTSKIGAYLSMFVPDGTEPRKSSSWRPTTTKLQTCGVSVAFSGN